MNVIRNIYLEKTAGKLNKEFLEKRYFINFIKMF